LYVPLRAVIAFFVIDFQKSIDKMQGNLQRTMFTERPLNVH
jgi:hypothetical protein